jgi:DNA-binding NtrC family response regulator
VDDVNTAVKAIRLGAYDYLVKPADNERLLLAINRAYEHKGLLAGLAGVLSGKEKFVPIEAFADIITQDRRLRELLSYAHIMARSDIAILITGESGTGKELLTKGIHRAGLRPDGPFIPVNITAVPETLFEGQFFGYAKGSFTGADRNYTGYFEQANGGTLFLDEIGELPLNLQPKFLRVLEEKSLNRLGDAKPSNVDVRIVSATSKDLDKSCQQGGFRLDLLYRLKGAHIHLPPLREREGDIPLLASHFLHKANSRYQKRVRDFSPEAMSYLVQKDFPGNIRELAQLIEQAVLLTDLELILPGHLGAGQSHCSSNERGLCSLKENADKHVIHVLTQTAGNKKQAAQILGITVRQLQRKVAEMKNDPRWQSFIRDL